MELLLKNLKLLKAVDSMVVEIDLLSCPQIIWYWSDMFVKYNIDRYAQVIKSGKVSIPGAVFRIFKIIPDDTDVKIVTTTRRLVVEYESALYKIKYHTSKIAIPQQTREDGRVAILTAENIYKAFTAFTDNEEYILINFNKEFAEYLSFGHEVWTRIITDCQATNSFSYCFDIKAVKNLKVFLRDTQGDVWVSGNENVASFTSEYWSATTAGKNFATRVWGADRTYELMIEADVDQLLRFFRILNISGMYCNIVIEKDCLIGETVNEMMSERIEIPACVYGRTGKVLIVNPKTVISVLESLKNFTDNVVIEFSENVPIRLSGNSCEHLIPPVVSSV